MSTGDHRDYKTERGKGQIKTIQADFGTLGTKDVLTDRQLWLLEQARYQREYEREKRRLRESIGAKKVKRTRKSFQNGRADEEPGLASAL